MTRKQKDKTEQIHREVGAVRPDARTERDLERLGWADKVTKANGLRRGHTADFK